MKKYKEWLTNEIEIMESETSENYPHEQMVEREVVLNLIDQLDEPEVRQIKELDSYNNELIRDNNQLRNALDNQKLLSQKWIDENSTNLPMSSPMTRWVSASKLQNLLVPKKEEITEEQAWEVIEDKYDFSILQNVIGYVEKEGYTVLEKPTIPQFVVDWIEKYIEYGYDLYPALKEMENNSRSWKKTYDWYRKNTYTFVNAYLTGEYEVEEEQKYYVIFPSMDENGKGFNYLAKDVYHNELWIEDSRTDGLDWEERSSFTEDEIRDLDKGDILFEHFAKKVEELEE